MPPGTTTLAAHARTSARLSYVGLYKKNRERKMCRNIKTLFNFDPPATDEEIRASAIQFVRKLSGSTKPSKANELAFDRAVEAISEISQELLQSLVTNALPKDREAEVAKARARTQQRFKKQGAGNAA
jgi:hypothetical protein